MESIDIKVLKKLSKAKLLRLLIKERKSIMTLNHENLLKDEDPFKDEVSQPITLLQKPTRRIPKLTRKPPPPPILQLN